MGRFRERALGLLFGEYEVKVLVDVPSVTEVLDGRFGELTVRVVEEARPAPRKSWWRRKVEPSAPTRALIEVTGQAAGSKFNAREQVVARVKSMLDDSRIGAVIIAAGVAVPDRGSADRLWLLGADGSIGLRRRLRRKLADGRSVTLYGDGDRTEFERRYRRAVQVWGLDPVVHTLPRLPGPAERRRDQVGGLWALLFVSPFLAMAVLAGLSLALRLAEEPAPVAGLGAWAGAVVFPWGAIASVAWALVPTWFLAALPPTRPLFLKVASRISGVILVVGSTLAFFVLLPMLWQVAPQIGIVTAVVFAIVFGTVAIRRIPPGRWRQAAGWGLPLVLGGFTPFAGDLLLSEGYLGAIGLRAHDVSVTGADRWLSGAVCTGIALAGAYLVLAGWGMFRRIGAVRGGVAGAFGWMVLLSVSVLYLLTAFLAGFGVARQAAEAGPGQLPGYWPGIHPTWVCWQQTGEGPVPFAGSALPPRDQAVVWLGTADGRHALWTPATRGVLVPDDVILRRILAAGPC
ncbi:hypothetical protein [Amycolatopsis magusensis]|uniref:hypothetical protein n=1 Tax=Amycolatopsis magusensis TaxID=882444 RepID=UPI0024A94B39|nr:hypothetical protein [Amycolatopsis magusensis]MDI5978399.1 hypothetical protein [Amycolatopsis magusensis]